LSLEVTKVRKIIQEKKNLENMVQSISQVKNSIKNGDGITFRFLATFRLLESGNT
jgi:hypothetical protein